MRCNVGPHSADKLFLFGSMVLVSGNAVDVWGTNRGYSVIIAYDEETFQYILDHPEEWEAENVWVDADQAS